MTKTQFSMMLSASKTNDLQVSVSIDEQILFQGRVDIDDHIITHDLPEEDDVEHTLCIEMSGKTQDDTKVDEQGNILEDLLINAKDLQFDGIDIDKIVSELAVYRHDFNGNGPETFDRFYGSMGCNGRVELKFTTPIYPWLLENM